MESDLIEVAGEDDSLLQQIPNDDVSSRNTNNNHPMYSDYFLCSPSMFPDPNQLLVRVSGMMVNEDIDKTSSSWKENINANKAEAPKLSVERQQMKRKKGVLNPAELSMISGNSSKSSGNMLSVIEEEGPQCTSDSSDLQVLEENLFKELPATTPNKDRNATGDLLPKHRSSPRSDARSANLNTAKDSKVSKLPVVKPDIGTVSRTAKSVIPSASASKRSQITQPETNIQKSTALKGSSNYTKNVLNNAKPKPGGKSLTSKTTIAQARRNVASSAKCLSTNLKSSLITEANNSLDVTSNTPVLCTTANSQTIGFEDAISISWILWSAWSSKSCSWVETPLATGRIPKVVNDGAAAGKNKVSCSNSGCSVPSIVDPSLHEKMESVSRGTNVQKVEKKVQYDHNSSESMKDNQMLHSDVDMDQQFRNDKIFDVDQSNESQMLHSSNKDLFNKCRGPEELHPTVVNIYSKAQDSSTGEIENSCASTHLRFMEKEKDDTRAVDEGVQNHVLLFLRKGSKDDVSNLDDCLVTANSFYIEEPKEKSVLQHVESAEPDGTVTYNDQMECQNLEDTTVDSKPVVDNYKLSYQFQHDIEHHDLPTFMELENMHEDQLIGAVRAKDVEVTCPKSGHFNGSQLDGPIFTAESKVAVEVDWNILMVYLCSSHIPPSAVNNQYSADSDKENKQSGYCEIEKSGDGIEQVSQDNIPGFCLNATLFANKSEEFREENVFESAFKQCDGLGNEPERYSGCAQASSLVQDGCLDVNRKDEYLQMEIAVTGSIEIEPSVDNLQCYTHSRHENEVSSQAAPLESDLSEKVNNNQISRDPLACNSMSFSFDEELGSSNIRDETSSSGSALQSNNAKVLGDEILPSEAENTLAHNSRTLNSELQHELENTIPTDKIDARTKLEKYGNEKKQDTLSIKPPLDAAPFSDEWLAAFEAAGEEILTIKVALYNIHRQTNLNRTGSMVTGNICVLDTPFVHC
ncbi:hypothetical protein FNV43_RR21483 [Rhamnella rubrinervis]|uniref:Uncharacterized protein n=1 Tax=Rhamnella rubrinervis TaxID=2594499 RepID=A0A8K0E2S4_9ROSA|nr:hypothetical protein FNV43_RR21483 [Rhamnella rubrinervis]